MRQEELGERFRTLFRRQMSIAKVRRCQYGLQLIEGEIMMQVAVLGVPLELLAAIGISMAKQEEPARHDL